MHGSFLFALLQLPFRLLNSGQSKQFTAFWFSMSLFPLVARHEAIKHS